MSPMDRDAALGLCRRLARADEEFPFGPGAAVFKVAGKVFAILSVDDQPGSISLKVDPGYAQVLREQYAAVTAGYHLDKRHWNTVALDGSVPDDVLEDWITDSYELVVSKLPRAQRPNSRPA
jgi:predicted DNA-binding protein (MmcQ/YjbR family)